MQPPLVVRPPTGAERQALAAGLRSPDAFVLRRCQVVLASARGERVPAIAVAVGCSEQAARDAIHAFDRVGVAALAKGSSRPPPRGCAGCGAARRGSSAARPACGRWSWRPRSPPSRGRRRPG